MAIQEAVQEEIRTVSKNDFIAVIVFCSCICFGCNCIKNNIQLVIVVML